ncbi:DUF423 domain-containing protein [Rodentibacter caecimuris]|uniref:DUF423 domain-containing protein n=1 Tax=Rodentibacter caecimuris TaxID=1796644 RepID=A0ABX3KV76_9PAST|nr:hypothetical protein BKG89_09645 [Rodentibacter heylii]
MKNKWLLFSAINGFFCVAFGAFAAHVLEKNLSTIALTWIDKGLKYQMFHSVALLSLGLFQYLIPARSSSTNKMLNFIAISWSSGILCFSGSLYAVALGVSQNLVWVTPIGGVLFLIGWSGLIYILLKNQLFTPID